MSSDRTTVHSRGAAVTSARDAATGTNVAQRSAEMLPKLHIPAGTRSSGDWIFEPTTVDQFASLSVIEMKPGEPLNIGGDSEHVALPLSGSFKIASDDGWSCRLDGRADVFASVTDFAYLGNGRTYRIVTDHGGQLALPSTPARTKIDPWYGPANSVEVEIRGAGKATRQLTNFLAPHIGGVDRLTCVEVLTPRGNWSSYPPHKHDVEVRDDAGVIVEANLEEIYYFRTETPHGFGIHRTYDLQRGWDVTVAVHDGDAFLVPTGYHGPCIASPDSALWYLNVLAGPAVERSLAFSDDPAHAHVREDWSGQELDPRVPMTSSTARS